MLTIAITNKLTYIFFCLVVLLGCRGVSQLEDTSRERLVLDRLKLRTIPEEVFEMNNLKELHLYGNLLDSIDPRIARLQSLEKLYIGRNNLKTLPKEIAQLKNLKLLSAQYNEIDSLPAEIGQLVNLEQLILNQNELRYLPNEIGQLKNLKSIQLNFNWLQALPESIGDCERLEFIYLNRNELEKLPESMGKLTQLRELRLHRAGNLVELPENLCDLRRFEYLEIDQTTAVPPCLLVRQTTRLRIDMH